MGQANGRGIKFWLFQRTWHKREWVRKVDNMFQKIAENPNPETDCQRKYVRKLFNYPSFIHELLSSEKKYRFSYIREVYETFVWGFLSVMSMEIMVQPDNDSTSF